MVIVSFCVDGIDLSVLSRHVKYCLTDNHLLCSILDREPAINDFHLLVSCHLNSI